jgi:hypothetical protein
MCAGGQAAGAAVIVGAAGALAAVTAACVARVDATAANWPDSCVTFAEVLVEAAETLIICMDIMLTLSLSIAMRSATPAIAWSRGVGGGVEGAGGGNSGGGAGGGTKAAGSADPRAGTRPMERRCRSAATMLGGGLRL